MNSRCIFFLAAVAAVLAIRPLAADTILGSKHDLTPVGPGPIKALSETEVCAFCHTPHRAISDTPLWSHVLSQATYVPYSSSTAKALIGQPTGSSKLCLSCHDGTVALGMVVNRPQPIAMQGGYSTMPAGPSNLGTDLSDDHPISFPYDAALASQAIGLKDPNALNPRVHLDENQQLQCTSCHDPHDNQYGQFLVMDNYASALCMACHNPPSWIDTTHRTSTATWNGTGVNPWPHTKHTTMVANACENCHAPHDAGTRPRLLTYGGEEFTCYVCHSGAVAAKDIAQEFDKFSAHPVAATTGVHDPTEDLLNPPRHVECVDCHNPHASNGDLASAPNASGRLAGVVGVNASGARVLPVTREDQLCYRCHGDSNNRGSAVVSRQFVETNTRLEFANTSASYHPVQSPRNNPDVPSLMAPWNASSVMYCTDCHNNDSDSGPRGPHGSVYAPLLTRNLELTDFQAENFNAYALCYKCHDRDNILSNDARSFPLHKEHVVDQKTACTTCHDSHGVSGQTHLINFNTTYVTPSASGRLEYNDTGGHSGNCALTCHGFNHDPAPYGPGPAPAFSPLRRRGVP